MFRCWFPSDKDNFTVRTAEFAPICDFALVNFCKGFNVDVGKVIVGVYDNRDTVIGQYRSDKAFICFFRFQRTARQTDITPSFRNGGYAGAGTGGLYGNFMSSFACIKASPKTVIFHGG